MSAHTSFPHPVLGNGDDIAHDVPQLDLTVDIVSGAIQFTLAPSPLASGHATIDSLVASDDAAWFLRIHCAKTYYRNEIRIAPQQPLCTVSADDVEGRVSCELFIVAVKDIDQYVPVGMHADYGNASFLIKKGEILAHCADFAVHIEPRFDPMAADAKSFVEFKRDESQQYGAVWVDYDEDVMAVNIPYGHWDMVAEMNALTPDILHSAVIFPVLIKAIEKRSAFEHRLWAGRLDAVMRAHNIADGDQLAAAQRILDNPVTRALTNAQRLIGER